MNAYDFSGEVAVITGGAQGIGLATARRMVEGGARVRLWDIDAAMLEKAKAGLGEACSVAVVDITDAAACRAAAEATVADLGKLSILVNSAGIAGLNDPVETYPVEEWLRIMNLNLNGTFFTNKAVVPHLKANGYGRIVNVASIAGKEGNPNGAAYSASKAGVIGLTKSLGKELAGQDIAVNCITPAAARTRIFDQMKPEFIDMMLSKIPRGRFVEVDEIAAMICFMASRENSFTTGGVFDISGGRATY
ncbi:3-oxoacyl-ACP reductase [Zhengella mangrovi]|uniref:3-oxoacyl-ACP reductase n=1 Tax=Zhengella mangrovi TaxID=1982044 RepID=A0A2G1QKF5_9HYPH|nr:SDR family NAD(P)-dependent oxidoreductase [Zhengella mangrovi]PHP66015.1 3-oxoacyl-ACP reductase [Zhengella mangrovi]